MMMPVRPPTRGLSEPVFCILYFLSIVFETPEPLPSPRRPHPWTSENSKGPNLGMTENRSQGRCDGWGGER